MKSIRNIAFAALMTIGAFSAVTYTSCNKDECKDVTCSNGGTCVSGVCQCPAGWEGTNCETRSNAKYVGVWAVTESCGGTNSDPYQVTITADPANPAKVLVSNLGNYDCTVGGTIVFDAVVNTTTITINDEACGTQMNATGTYNNGSISFSYTAKYGVTTDNCTATLTK